VELIAPPHLAAPRMVVPRPRISTPFPGAAGNTAGDVPLLAPQLSVEEAANDRREANQNIGAAEKVLVSIRGRSLNASQADLASKVRGFVADAKDAARVGDWDRARSLAKKAQVLSQELLASF
jgi:hypothetical protein